MRTRCPQEETDSAIVTTTPALSGAGRSYGGEGGIAPQLIATYQDLGKTANRAMCRQNRGVPGSGWTRKIRPHSSLLGGKVWAITLGAGRRNQICQVSRYADQITLRG